MKISGFTFVRNAIRYDYPVLESIKSILPMVDEFVVAVGNSEDGMLDLIKSISSPKIRIIETIWDDSLREGGHVLALETNKAFAAISPDADWAFYLQADEVVHEKYLDIVREACLKYKDDTRVEGLLFNYLHFYGSYSWIGDSRQWYRHEIRMVKNLKGISSYKDAQGFRINGRKLKVKLIDAYIYHYGWVKPPEKQKDKQLNFSKYWHDDQWMVENIAQVPEYDYSQSGMLKAFDDSHPQVMQERVASWRWPFNFDSSKVRTTLKSRISGFIEKHTGWRPGEYKNYRKLS